MALWTVGERIEGLTVEGRAVHAAVFDEVQVRAAAGLTLAAGTIAFVYAYFEHQFVPIRIVATMYFFDFLIRVTAGLRYSPTGALARLLTRGRTPEWVSAKPKRFAWTLGMLMSGATAIITNIPIHGYPPRILCLGCQIHVWLVKRGWRSDDPAYEICAGGVCDLPAPAAATPATAGPVSAGV